MKRKIALSLIAWTCGVALGVGASCLIYGKYAMAAAMLPIIITSAMFLVNAIFNMEIV